MPNSNKFQNAKSSCTSTLLRRTLPGHFSKTKAASYRANTSNNNRNHKLLLIIFFLASFSVPTFCQNTPPTFTDEQYRFRVDENSVSGTQLTQQGGQISATDVEDTPTYEIVSTTVPFTINSTTGILTTTMVLDREQDPNNGLSFTFSIRAVDITRELRIYPTANVFVVVDDVNDNIPVFSTTQTILFSIDEGTTNGHLIHKVTATDIDSGNNANVFFYINSGNNEGLFLVDITSGEIRTVIDEDTGKILNFDVTQSYSLEIIANNSVSTVGIAQLFATEIFTINLNNLNDEDPLFTTGTTDITIIAFPETSVMNDVVFTVSAEDSQEGMATGQTLSTTFTYQIIRGNTDINGTPSFKIDATSGVVSVNAANLDYEVVPSYVLFLQATEDQPPKATVTTTLTIDILDNNEHPPLFVQATYTKSISEGSAAGTTVLTVSANDMPEMDDVLYSFPTGVNANVDAAFSVDSQTGILTLDQRLDRELIASYMFTIIATDSMDTTLTDTATIAITVTDINDNSPVFTDLDVPITTDEGLTRPYALYDVGTNNPASDIDDGTNKQIKYSLKSHDATLFSIDETTGIITVLNNVAIEIDHESINTQYTFQVEAQDQAVLVSDRRVGSFTLVTTVVDINDNDPVIVFSGATTVTIDEGLGNTVLFSLTATDPDSINANTLVFSLVLPASAPPIVIDSATGVISTSGPLDYEDANHQSISITVMLTDGTRVVTLALIVTTNDVNDNAPVFQPSAAYSFTVLEDDDGTTAIGTVSITDEDSGNLGVAGLVYTVTGTNLFTIPSPNSNPAMIFSTGLLDYELAESIIFTIIAADSNNVANTARKASATITITITNVIDETPAFPDYPNDIVQVTILEAMTINNIFTFSASDRDNDGTNKIDTLTYTIVTATITPAIAANSFLLGNATGILATNPLSLPDHETIPVVQFDVLVTDAATPTGFTDTLTIEITVDDVNDNDIAFSINPFTLSLDENTLTGSIIITISATEATPDENTVITHSIDTINGDSDATDFFRIGSFTGEITLIKSLDFEAKTSHMVAITATDGTHSADTVLQLTVNNVNDNDPTIAQSTPCTTTIPEYTATSTVICTFDVSDRDDDGGAADTFRLKQAGFTLDPTTLPFTFAYTAGAAQATLTLGTALDFEATTSYTFTITLTDDGPLGKLTAQIDLFTITVTDTNDNDPIFQPNTYSFTVSEEEPVNNPVGSVTATDADSGAVFGSFVFSTSSTVFAVDANTGVLTLLTALNREAISSYTVTVTVTDGGAKTDTASVVITVEDSNDNPPIFMTVTIISINETQVDGTVVTTVTATDLDSGTNGDVSYRIEGTTGGGAFNILSSTGQIYVENSNQIDYEVRQTYSLNVIAEDNGASRRQASVIQIINIIDENDNPPVFVSVIPTTLSFAEDFVGTILYVSATDADSAAITNLTYSLTPTTFFSILAIGEVRTVAINREVTPTTSFVICVSDGTTNICAPTITVTIIDINDNDPTIPSAAPDLSRDESTAGGNVLFTYVPADLDLNPDFSYVLDDGGGPFRMDQAADSVIVSGDSSTMPLDFEGPLTQFTLTVTIFDGQQNPRSVTDSFVVTILDINDNAPIFSQANYIVSEANAISEADTGATPVTVITVSASDLDTAPNNVVEYTLTNDGGGRFEISSTLGIIKTTGTTSIDFESNRFFLLTVTATDTLDSSFVDTANVYVPIKDRNDVTPGFTSSSYTFLVIETIPINSAVGAVEATDVETSNGYGIITYTFKSTTPTAITNTFAIEASTGVISTKISLDFDAIASQYVFTVVATDTPTDTEPRLSSEVLVTVNLVNENEDGPTFSLSFYPVDQIENVKNLDILTVVATETDASAIITYSIVETTTIFTLGASTGILRIVETLDREVLSAVTFTVKAVDNAANPRTGLATVRITVLDANDETPAFQLNTYSASIVENSVVNTVLLTAIAADADAEAPNNIFVYSVLEAGAPVEILSDGRIRLTISPNFEDTASYMLTLNATDQGTPPNVGIATFTLTINDVNDLFPVIQNNPADFTFSAIESLPGDSELVAFNVTDADTVGAITYRIDTSSPRFLIDSVGRLKISSVGLNFEAEQSHTLVIIVSDGVNEVSQTVTITVIDANDFVPVFQPSLGPFSLDETNNIGTLIAVISATDGDAVDTTLTFSIAGENPSGFFRLTDSGQTTTITSKLSLDREAANIPIDNVNGNAVFSLILVVTDTGSNQDTAAITINVQDINDNPPVFTAITSPSISESQPAGVHVIALTATDADFGATLTYSISPAVNFMIDSSGLVTTKVIVFKGTYPVTVTASDGTLMGVITFTITVTDLNDNNPQFQLTQYTPSVSEGATSGTNVVAVQASDADEGTNAQLLFSIIGGDENNQFAIVTTVNTGTLNTNNMLDRETIDRYVLIVQAADQGSPQRFGTTTVVVTVTDVNDEIPMFDFSQYSGTISEGAMVGSAVTVTLDNLITATDNDDPASAGSQFDITLTDATFEIGSSLFVSKKSGVELDRETNETYLITLTVTDKLAPFNSMDVLLTITVTDINDNPPVFSPATYTATLDEDLAINSPVVIVTATDIDLDSNGEVSYFITAGGEGKFRIDPNSGAIILETTLDYETTPSHTLTITAFDKGVNFLSADTTLIITVVDVNDNTPMFDQNFYMASVTENLMNVNVLTVTASDLDDSTNAAIVFSFVNPDPNLPFILTSGVISVPANGQTDRETTPSYTLTVQAKDSPTDPLLARSTTVTVIITIDDVNDVPPQFSNDQLSTNIPEQTAVTTIVLFAAAFDPDLGDGGLISYFISDHPDNVFGVVEATGAITLLLALNLEGAAPTNLAQYSFRVRAVDQDSTNPLTSFANVTINVIDSDDNVPTFNNSFFLISIPENTSVSTTISQVVAVDVDNPNSMTIVYTILGGDTIGNSASYFGIVSSTGHIFTRLVFTGLSEGLTFTLTIRAADSVNTLSLGLTSVQITITDNNDNAPIFCQSANYEFDIAENAVALTTVGTLCASDLDAGANGQFVFSITSGNVPAAFSLPTVPTSSTAILRLETANVLDREMKSVYSLVVTVADRGSPSMENSIPVIITITDVNDNPPIINNLPASMNILEDAFGGSEIYTVNATDLDDGSNSLLVYAIEDNSNTDFDFKIDSSTGIITLRNPLDFDLGTKVYSLEITVTDQAAPGDRSSTTAILTINVDDVNDNFPVFTNALSTSIPENLANGSDVLQLTATDLDSGVNEIIDFAIVGGINSSHFAIDTNTDFIIVSPTTTLDRETQSIYNLIINASDQGTPQLFTTATITITILDANDHSPVFSIPGGYTFTISENNDLNAIVDKVIATDQDSDSNGEIAFSILSGNASFTVDPITGDIRVGAILNREEITNYTLMVQALDGGGRATTVSVVIIVNDVNDVTPVIDISDFTIPINENTAITTIIKTVEATDFDFGLNSQIRFSFLGEGHMDKFQIDPITGSVSVKSALNIEETSRFDIVVQASDSGIPSLEDNENLVITLIDVNEFPPFFDGSIFPASITENAAPGTFVITVSASDADFIESNTNVTYSIASAFINNFMIDPILGTVTTLLPYDRELVPFIIIDVIGTNARSNIQLSGSGQINITLLDLNDKVPSFSQLLFTGMVSELAESNDAVLTLAATDEDDPLTENARFLFSSSPTNTAEFSRAFRIDENTGILHVKGTLDRETQDFYTAIAIVTDQGVNPLSNQTNIEVMITDENDIPPTFTSLNYTISYDEDLNPASQASLDRLLLTLNFTDDDLLTVNKASTFQFAANSPVVAGFRLDPSGQFYVSMGLDRESRDSYTIYVEVVNTLPGHTRGTFCTQAGSSRGRTLLNGDCELYHSSTVTLIVEDINDNNPVFTLTEFFFSIDADANPKTLVGLVSATDMDLGLFGTIRYSSGTPNQFSVDSITGSVANEIVVTDLLAQTLSFTAVASDLGGGTSMLSGDVPVRVSVLNNGYRALLVIQRNLSSVSECIDDLINTIESRTNYRVFAEEFRAHVDAQTSVVNDDITDVIIYALDASQGTSYPVITNENLIKSVDDSVSDQPFECQGGAVTISNVVFISEEVAQVSQFLVVLIVICVVLCCIGTCLNGVAIHQRVIGLRDKSRMDNYIYSEGMEGLDVLTTTHAMQPEPLALIDDISYESQELRMDMFLDEIPEEFISSSEGSTMKGSLLDEALGADNDSSTIDDLIDDISVTAI